MNWKRLLMIATGAIALLVMPGAAQADNCSNRIRKEERELDKAVRRHGMFSRQALEERREIARLRASCRRESRFRQDDRFFRNRDRFEHERWNRRHNERREERREHHGRRDRDRDGDHDRD